MLDREELFWSETGNLLLHETETGDKRVTFVDKQLLALYRKKINAFISRIKSYCAHYGINYFLCNTSIPFEETLTDYLSTGALFR